MPSIKKIVFLAGAIVALCQGSSATAQPYQPRRYYVYPPIYQSTESLQNARAVAQRRFTPAQAYSLQFIRPGNSGRGMIQRYGLPAYTDAQGDLYQDYYDRQKYYRLHYREGRYVGYGVVFQPQQQFRRLRR